MTDETTTLPVDEVPEVESAAPGPETTAAPVPDTSPEEQTEKAPEERLLTQAEVDAIVGKRLARERRSWEREQQAAAQPQAPTGDLSPDQFETPEAYQEALIAKKASELVAAREMQRQRAAVIEAHEDRQEKAREKYTDYDAVIQNPTLRITPVMADVIMASDAGPDVAYYLGTNPQEAERIASMPPFLQAKEIGRLETKLAFDPPVKRTSSAPAPITPIRTPASKPVVHDTTDPRSTGSLSVSEWIAQENKREQARLEARFH